MRAGLNAGALRQFASPYFVATGPASPQRTPTYASGCRPARASSGSQLAPVPVLGLADLHPQDAQGMRGEVVVERGPADLAPTLPNADHVRALEGVDGAHVGAGDVGDEEPARHRRAAEIDGRGVAALAIAIHHGEGELAGGGIPGRGGVQQREWAEVGHVVHSPDYFLLPIGG